MSYDIYLKDPVTEEVAKVPGHLMTGGTFRADYHPETGTFTPALNTNADLNITYNYSRYYYEVYPKEGIRTIYGMAGLDSISILSQMISAIEEHYKVDGKWISTQRKDVIYCDESGTVIDNLKSLFHRDGLIQKEVEKTVCEGDTSDYWKATAANAIKPLYQLIELAKMRPDCVWDGD